MLGRGLAYAIVPAAGESRRMGRQKALLPYAGTTVIGHIAGQLLGSRLDGVYVVTGHNAEPIRAALAEMPVDLVHNPDYRDGMLSSVRAGLAALPRETATVMMALGDQPALSGSAVNALLDARAATGKSILVPAYQGQRGHPILFDYAYCEEIMQQFEDTGLRGLLHAHPGEVETLALDSPSILSDLDTPEDYARALAGLEELEGRGI